MSLIESFQKLPTPLCLSELDHLQTILNQDSCELGRTTLALAMTFEDLRKRGQILEEKLNELQMQHTKTEAEKNALTVKLKHARRQIEVEIDHRQKAEQDRDDLDSQLMLVRDLLFNNSDTGSCGLNEEQQKKLDFLNSSRYLSPREGGRRTVKRLERIDETESFLSNYSEISFDYTEDDLDATTLRNGKRYNKRRRAAEQRAMMADDEYNNKKFKCHAGPHESININVDGPAKVSLEKSFSKPVPHQGRRRPSREHRRRSAGYTDTESATTDSEALYPAAGAKTETTPTKLTGILHDMQIKPCVITKETCKPCGRRIQFGKKAMKCANCRLVTHVECESQARQYTCDPSNKSPSLSNSPSPKGSTTSLADYVTATETAQIPPLIYYTLQEIENRGLQEQGLYRIPGMVRTVRELKEKFLRGKSIPDLTKVDEVHTLCSLVKEFLRETIPEPLLTFGLYQQFVDASSQSTDADLYQAFSELPTANRDTLAYIMLHLQRVVDDRENRMTLEALSKAMGPSLIGYPNADPSIQEIQNAAIVQEQVMTRLLNLPNDYYSTFIKDAGYDTKYNYKAPESLLGPIGMSPKKTPSGNSLAERAKKYLHGTPFGKSSNGKRKEGTYFSSPVL